MAINRLSGVTDLNLSDQFPLASLGGGDDQKATLTQLVAFLNGELTLPSATLAEQHAAPSATGFNIAVTVADTWLVLTPTGAFAAGTITLPAAKEDHQEVLVNCTQAVTTLTVSGNGTTVTGAPTTLAANAFFRLRYDMVNNVWYRVG